MPIQHIIFSGPSASGKSTLIKKVLESYPYLSLSVSHTTRPMRKGEVDGKDYYFISKEAFEGLIKDKRMLEFVFFNGNYYGTSYSELEHTPKIFDVEYKGVSYFQENYPDFLFIYIDCDRENVRKRLVARGDPEKDIAERLKLYDKFLEMKDKGVFQKIVNNNKSIKEAFQEIVDFLKERKVIKE